MRNSNRYGASYSTKQYHQISVVFCNDGLETLSDNGSWRSGPSLAPSSLERFASLRKCQGQNVPPCLGKRGRIQAKYEHLKMALISKPLNVFCVVLPYYISFPWSAPCDSNLCSDACSMSRHFVLSGNADADLRMSLALSEKMLE